VNPNDSGDVVPLSLWVADLLQANDFPYAIGGALSMANHGFARATHDVDINVFIEHNRIPAFLELLAASGFFVPPNAQKQLEEDGWVATTKSGTVVDFFTPSIPLSWDAMEQKVQSRIGNNYYWFLSPESLCLFKLMFFRPKDLADLDQFLRAPKATIDRAIVRQKIAEAMGDDDARVAAWDKLVAEADAEL
jgi:hypothetical protein